MAENLGQRIQIAVKSTYDVDTVLSNLCMTQNLTTEARALVDRYTSKKNEPPCSTPEAGLVWVHAQARGAMEAADLDGALRLRVKALERLGQYVPAGSRWIMPALLYDLKQALALGRQAKVALRDAGAGIADAYGVGFRIFQSPLMEECDPEDEGSLVWGALDFVVALVPELYRANNLKMVHSILSRLESARFTDDMMSNSQFCNLKFWQARSRLANACNISTRGNQEKSKTHALLAAEEFANVRKHCPVSHSNFKIIVLFEAISLMLAVSANPRNFRAYSMPSPEYLSSIGLEQFSDVVRHFISGNVASYRAAVECGKNDFIKYRVWFHLRMMEAVVGWTLLRKSWKILSPSKPLLKIAVLAKAFANCWPDMAESNCVVLDSMVLKGWMVGQIQQGTLMFKPGSDPFEG